MKTGIPEKGGGFAIGLTPDQHNLTLSPGRISIHGALYELTTWPRDFFILNRTNPGQSKEGTYLVYLDCWEHTLTDVEDVDIRETALNEPGTTPDETLKTMTIFQLILEPILKRECPDHYQEFNPAESRYCTGDYWEIPSRTILDESEWPGPDEPCNNLPKYPSKDQDVHHYCPLAVVKYRKKTTQWAVLHDCRMVIPDEYSDTNVTIYANVVPASHGETKTEVLGPGDEQDHIIISKITPIPRHITMENIDLSSDQRRVLNQIISHGRLTMKSGTVEGIRIQLVGQNEGLKHVFAFLLAKELDRDIFRIDLSAVVDKYIGETEKNLHELFDAADVADSILLFDEADALFGRRSEVKDAHDRYENTGLDFIDFFENYQGFIIVSVRRVADTAISAKFNFTVKFPRRKKQKGKRG